jgi:hypothetical protein
MGIRDNPTAPASPWQNGFAGTAGRIDPERVFGHTIVLGEAHLRRILKFMPTITSVSEPIDL